MAIDTASLDAAELAAEFAAATAGKEAAMARLRAARYDVTQAHHRLLEVVSEQTRRLLQVPDPLPVALRLYCDETSPRALDVIEPVVEADAAVVLPEEWTMWLTHVASKSGGYIVPALDLDRATSPEALADAAIQLIERWSAHLTYPDEIEFLLGSYAESWKPEGFASVHWQRSTGTATVRAPGRDPVPAGSLAEAFALAAASAAGTPI